MPNFKIQIATDINRLMSQNEKWSLWAVAQTNRLPFDRLRANGDIFKSCDFSAHAELVEA
jgi:hypothetical protein